VGLGLGLGLRLGVRVGLGWGVGDDATEDTPPFVCAKTKTTKDGGWGRGEGGEGRKGGQEGIAWILQKPIDPSWLRSEEGSFFMALEGETDRHGERRYTHKSQTKCVI
jgi:hypothetical protein